jgi:hypothetical protein
LALRLQNHGGMFFDASGADGCACGYLTSDHGLSVSLDYCWWLAYMYESSCVRDIVSRECLFLCLQVFLVASPMPH